MGWVGNTTVGEGEGMGWVHNTMVGEGGRVSLGG